MLRSTVPRGAAAISPSRETAAALADGWRSLDKRVAFALAYTALILALQEYFFIPGAVARHGWFRAFAQQSPGMSAGLAWIASNVLFFLVIPALIVRVGHREGLASIGWSARGLARHVPLYLGLFLLVLPLVIVASLRPEFVRTYPFVAAARTSIGTFLVWECAYVLSFVALEAFFRGYLLFTCAARMGWTSIFVMVVPYTMIHFHKPMPECLGAIVAGVALGALALTFRSFWGGVVVHVLVAVTMDALAVHRAGLF